MQAGNTRIRNGHEAYELNVSPAALAGRSTGSRGMFSDETGKISPNTQQQSS